LASDISGGKMAAANDFCVGGLGFFQSSKMSFRDDEHMSRRLGIDILETEDVLILVDFLGRNFAADDAAEKAIRIGHLRHLSQSLAER